MEIKAFNKDVKELIELYRKNEVSDLENYMDRLDSSYHDCLKTLSETKKQLILTLFIYILSLTQENLILTIGGLQFDSKFYIRLIIPLFFYYLLNNYVSIANIKEHLRYIYIQIAYELKRPEYKTNLHLFSLPFGVGLFEEIYHKKYNTNNFFTNLLDRLIDTIMLSFIIVPIVVLVIDLFNLTGLEFWVTIIGIIICTGYFIGIFINIKNTNKNFDKKNTTANTL